MVIHRLLVKCSGLFYIHCGSIIKIQWLWFVRAFIFRQKKKIKKERKYMINDTQISHKVQCLARIQIHKQATSSLSIRVLHPNSQSPGCCFSRKMDKRSSVVCCAEFFVLLHKRCKFYLPVKKLSVQCFRFLFCLINSFCN